MPNVFSRATLAIFEDASASIPLRRIDRAFEAAEIPLGEDPGGPEGSRRTQFRRYVAGVDQRELAQLLRLGDALGALTGEVATSKVDFLTRAAQSDGFSFVDGVFRPAQSSAASFAVTRLDDLASLDERVRRLQLLAHDRPNDAIAGAQALIESLCHTVLRLLGEPLPEKASNLTDVASVTLDALGVSASLATSNAELVRGCLQQLATFVDAVAGPHHVEAHQARLAVGVSGAFAAFVADAYVERDASAKRDASRPADGTVNGTPHRQQRRIAANRP